jgi:hypothetical protein
MRRAIVALVATVVAVVLAVSFKTHGPHRPAVHHAAPAPSATPLDRAPSQ